ncbi:hypothetical protein [Sphingopyxis macrogoltabida]|uniref:hypothetical protein n=1 Tax=Sphingopyxis macrogoltabida TaxID=33050 RepID=UPI0011EA625B|nr:hypothetical protein [Sphingopyxis macrogoltabida]
MSSKKDTNYAGFGIEMIIDEIREKLASATRPQLMESVAAAIQAFTVMARDTDQDEHRTKINNCIHYLAGRMIGLSIPAN